MLLTVCFILISFRTKYEVKGHKVFLYASTGETVGTSDPPPPVITKHINTPPIQNNHPNRRKGPQQVQLLPADASPGNLSLHAIAPASPTIRHSDQPFLLPPLLLKSYRTVDLGGGL